MKKIKPEMKVEFIWSDEPWEETEKRLNKMYDILFAEVEKSLALKKKKE